MSYVLAWHNLIFFIPLALGVLLALGASMGALGGADGDIDVDVNADSHGSDVIIEALSLLGVGRVPLAIVLLTAALMFGSAGFIANVWLEPVLGAPAAFAPLSAVMAILAMFAFTGRVARLVSKVVPTTESYHVTKTDLLGRLGTLVLPANGITGLLQVKDHEGNLHQVQCRTRGRALSKGVEVLIVDRDENEDAYIVEQRPRCLDEFDVR